MAACFCTYRNGNTGNPYIFFIHAIRHPQVSVLRFSIAFLNAACILRTIRFIIASITHGRNFSVYQIQCCILEPVLAQGDGQWPTEFGRIVYSGIHAVAQSLSPDFGITVHKTLGT